MYHRIKIKLIGDICLLEQQIIVKKKSCGDILLNILTSMGYCKYMYFELALYQSSHTFADCSLLSVLKSS